MQDLVAKNNSGKLVITSLRIAEEYNKRHDNVLRAIRHYINDIQDIDFTLLNFEELENIRVFENKKEVQPYFELSETAALAITGRFNGREAAKHQLRIAKQFIAMRDHIRTLESNQFKVTNEQLIEANKKLAFCKIDERCMKAIIKERDNHKVSEITNLMAELGLVQITDAVRHYKKVASTDIGMELGILIQNNTPIYPEEMHDKIRGIAETKAVLQQKIRNLSQYDIFGYEEAA